MDLFLIISTSLPSLQMHVPILTWSSRVTSADPEMSIGNECACVCVCAHAHSLFSENIYRLKIRHIRKNHCETYTLRVSEDLISGIIRKAKPTNGCLFKMIPCIEKKGSKAFVFFCLFVFVFYSLHHFLLGPVWHSKSALRFNKSTATTITATNKTKTKYDKLITH